MLVWLTLPFYDFCGFRSVAVNSVYKLQFFYIHPVYYRPEPIRSAVEDKQQVNVLLFACLRFNYMLLKYFFLCFFSIFVVCLFVCFYLYSE